MKIIHSYNEFKVRTKPIRDEFELDIEPDTLLGIFLPHRLKELVRFCSDYPKFHIISGLPGMVKMNRAVENASFYLLAEGETDPELCYCLQLDEERLSRINGLQL